MNIRLLDELPSEVIAKVATSLDYEGCLRLSSHPIFLDLMGHESFWNHMRLLQIKSHKQLQLVLTDMRVRKVSRLDLSACSIDDTELGWISDHFRAIKNINLGNNPDLNDEGIEILLRSHGTYLQNLDLSKLFRLTNKTLDNILRYCRSLKSLTLDGCMFTSDALLVMLSESSFYLTRLSLSRCHLLSPMHLPAMTLALSKLQELNLSFLDGLEPYQVQAIIGACQKLQRVNLKGCCEITKKAIREMEMTRPDMTFDHNAVLEDHTIVGVQRFLLAMVNS